MSDRRGQAANSQGPANESQDGAGRLPRERTTGGATTADPSSGAVNAAGAWAKGWRWIILVAAASTALLSVMDASGPLRVIVTIGFLVVCPGMSLTRLVDLRDPLAETALAIAMSVALVGLVGGTLLYLGLWSPGAGSAILIAIALGGLAADLLRERRDLRVLVRGLAARLVGAAPSGMSEPKTPDAELAPARVSARATPPRQPAEQSATPVRDPTQESPAPRRRRQPGETAPDFLLRSPTSVTPVADDFFDGLIQRVEHDR